MRTIWNDDYILVMSYVNEYCLDTFASVRVTCKPSDVNQLNLSN
jgi:hypothetical protein